MELYQTKQAIDQLFSQRKRPNLSYWKNSFGSKGSQAPSYNLAVYDFLKGLYGELDKATEARQQNKILTALLEQIQSLLPQVEDQGRRAAFEAGLAQLGKEARSRQGYFKWGSTSTRNQWYHWKAKTKSKRKSLKLGMSPFINSSITSWWPCTNNWRTRGLVMLYLIA